MKKVFLTYINPLDLIPHQTDRKFILTGYLYSNQPQKSWMAINPLLHNIIDAFEI